MRVQMAEVVYGAPSVTAMRRLLILNSYSRTNDKRERTKPQCVDTTKIYKYLMT